MSVHFNFSVRCSSNALKIQYFFSDLSDRTSEGPSYLFSLVTTQCLSLTLVVHFQDIVLAKHGWIFARIMPKGKTTVQQRDSFSTGLEINQPY